MCDLASVKIQLHHLLANVNVNVKDLGYHYQAPDCCSRDDRSDMTLLPFLYKLLLSKVGIVYQPRLTSTTLGCTGGAMTNWY